MNCHRSVDAKHRPVHIFNAVWLLPLEVDYNAICCLTHQLMRLEASRLLCSASRYEPLSFWVQVAPMFLMINVLPFSHSVSLSLSHTYDSCYCQYIHLAGFLFLVSSLSSHLPTIAYHYISEIVRCLSATT
jgi:hypothetical protein